MGLNKLPSFFGSCFFIHHLLLDYAPLAFSCEADKTITLEPCQNTTVVSWDTPTWVDDITGIQSFMSLMKSRNKKLMLPDDNYLFRNHQLKLDPTSTLIAGDPFDRAP